MTENSSTNQIKKTTSLNTLNGNDKIHRNKYIEEFVCIKRILETIDTNNFIVNRIYKDVKTYIEVNCDHSVIDDYVDLDPDNGGKPIKYCEYCYKSF